MEHVSKKIIGLRQYQHLKKFKNLSQEEKKSVEDYETLATTEEQIKAEKDYNKKIKEPEAKPQIIQKFDADKLKLAFNRIWLKTQKKPFDISSNEALENLRTLVYFFAKDNRFLSHENVIKEFNFDGVVKKAEPSFDKGLLIIGGYGNGKTSMMRVFTKMFQGKKGHFFKEYNANIVIDMYEGEMSKTEFWKIMQRDKIYLDDVKTEKIANKYGKANIFREVLEKRCSLGLFQTYITANYSDDAPNDLNEALLEFSDMYGNRVFDRLFEMFNIIEFKGKSFRGR